MKYTFKILFFLLFVLSAPYSMAQENISEIKKGGEEFYTDATSFFSSLKNGGASSSLSGAGNELNRMIDEALNGADSPLKKLQEGLKDPNIKPEDLAVLMSDAKNYIKNFKSEVLKSGLNNFLQNDGMSQQLDGLIGQAGGLLEKAQDLIDFGYGFNAPIGLKGEPVDGFYFSVKMDSISYKRDPQDMANCYTKGRMFVEVALPILPEQSDGSHKIAFAGDVQFQKGDPSVKSRIYLDIQSTGKDEYRIPFVKNKIDLVFIDVPSDKTDGNCVAHAGERSYIEFNCDGITDFKLNGYLDFKRKMLVPMEESDIADEKADIKKENGEIEKAKYDEYEKHKAWIPLKDEKKTVKAYFNIAMSHGPCVAICFNHPFRAKNAKNFVWEVHESVFDFSTARNAPGFKLPDGYMPEGMDEASWTGIYIKEVDCHFPEDFKLNDTDTFPEASVYDVFIDDYGFTAKAKVTNIINKGLGNSGARIALDTITAEVYQNEFMSASLKGSAAIPFLREVEEESANSASTTTREEQLREDEASKILKFDIDGRIDYSKEKDEYYFDAKASVNIAKKYKVPFTELATITVNPGTGISLTNYKKTVVSVGDDNTGETVNEKLPKLRFDLTLNGSLDINSDVASAVKGSSLFGFDCQFDGVAFEDLHITNVAPKVSIKSLALKGKAQARFLGMTLVIDSLHWTNSRFAMNKSLQEGEQSYGGLDMRSFIELVPDDGGFGICPRLGARFKSYYGKLKDASGDPRWHFAGIDVNNIAINMDFPAFSLKGNVDLYKDDPAFGKGFKGIVDFKLNPLDIAANVQACFGRVNKNGETLKYWFTKANCSFNPGIPIFASAKLRALTGGAYYHMHDAKHEQFGKDIKDVKATQNPDAAPSFMFANVANYVPTDKVKFGIILGAGMNFGNDALATVNAELNMSFASCGALDRITLGGEFTMICPTPKFLTTVQGSLDQLNNYDKNKTSKLYSENKVLSNLREYLEETDNLGGGETRTGSMGGDAKNGTVFGWACMEYNHTSKYFWLDSRINAEIGDEGKLLKGRASVNMLIDKDEWYFRIGTDTDPATLTLLDGFAQAKTYFMTGVLPSAQLQPLSKDMNERFTMVDRSSSTESMKAAKGMAFALNTKAHLKFDDFPLIFAEFGFEGGTDLLIRKCTYTYEDKEYKWRGSGSIYGYVAVDLGVKFFRHEWDVIEANAFAGFMGEAPAPVKGEALMSFYVKVARIIKTTAKLRVKIGEDEKIENLRYD